MKSVFRRLWLLAAILLIIILFIAPANLRAQSVVSLCKCEDKADLLNELNMANAALSNIQQYMKTAKPTEMVNEIPLGQNPTKMTKGNILINAINEARNLVNNEKARSGSVTTNSVTCESEVNADTPCLKSLLERYGAERRATCENQKKKSKLGENEDIMNFWPMDDYLLKLSNDYNELIKEILNRLNALPKTCRPGDWFGSITVTENIQQKTTVGKETAEDTTTRTGKIWFNGNSGNPFSSWKVKGKYVNTKTGGGTVFCKGGLAGAKDEKKYTTSFKLEFNKSGGGLSQTEVSLGEPDEGNKIVISFRIPDVEVKGDGQSISTRSSGCPNDDVNETNPLTALNANLNSEAVQFQGAYFKGDPEKITGSEMINFGFPFKNDFMTMSHTVQVTCNLYKLKR